MTEPGSQASRNENERCAEKERLVQMWRHADRELERTTQSLEFFADRVSRSEYEYTRYGKGVFIYTSYAWLRQLPAGVPGAYRLCANMISR